MQSHLRMIFFTLGALLVAIPFGATVHSILEKDQIRSNMPKNCIFGFLISLEGTTGYTDSEAISTEFLSIQYYCNGNSFKIKTIQRHSESEPVIVTRDIGFLAGIADLIYFIIIPIIFVGVSLCIVVLKLRKK